MPQPNSEVVLQALAAAVAAHPEQRVGQVVVNALGSDPFYVENAEAAHRLADYAMGVDAVSTATRVIQPTADEAVSGGHEKYGF